MGTYCRYFQPRLQMEISVPRDNCFGGNSAEPHCPPNTDIPRDGNFESHFKPMKDTYNHPKRWLEFNTYLICSAKETLKIITKIPCRRCGIEQTETQKIGFNLIEWGLRSFSTQFRLFNYLSSFIGGGRPQNNSDWLEPPSFRNYLDTFSHRVSGRAGREPTTLAVRG